MTKEERADIGECSKWLIQVLRNLIFEDIDNLLQKNKKMKFKTRTVNINVLEVE